MGTRHDERRRNTVGTLAVTLAVAIVVAACGGGDTSAQAEPPSTTAPASSGVNASSNGGGIVATVGDETWEFDGALCAYRGGEPGTDGSEWNVSFTQNDVQVYVDVKTGVYATVSITNVVDFGSLQWVAEGDAIEVTVDGNDITAEGTFTDETGSGIERSGSVTGTCPYWAQA